MRAANGPAALVRPPAIGTALRELASLRFSQLCAGSRNAVPLDVLLNAELALIVVALRALWSDRGAVREGAGGGEGRDHRVRADGGGGARLKAPMTSPPVFYQNPCRVCWILKGSVGLIWKPLGNAGNVDFGLRQVTPEELGEGEAPLEGGAPMVLLGLGRIVALYHHSSTLCQIH